MVSPFFVIAWTLDKTSRINAAENRTSVPTRGAA